jgi:diguanylate cyclase (GGDEF)-like protein/PAS domain S-box-containing protein
MATSPTSNNNLDLHSVYQNLPIALCLVGRDGRLMVVNEVHAKLAGRSANELVGARVADLHEQGGKNVERDFRYFDRGVAVPDHELEVRGRLYMVSTSPVLDADGKVIAISVAHIDITEKKAIERRNQRMTRQLREMAILDHLTRSYNRREFDRLLKKSCHSLRRTGREFAVILFDIDHFKSYNDLYGHQAGDQCLRRVASVAHDVVKRHDATLCRYGGEEFVVLVEMADPAIAVALADRVRLAVRRLSLAHGRGINNIVTISCGVASTLQFQRPISPEIHLEIIRAADKALYRAKDDGRDTVSAFDPLRYLAAEQDPAHEPALPRADQSG